MCTYNTEISSVIKLEPWHGLGWHNIVIASERSMKHSCLVEFQLYLNRYDNTLAFKASHHDGIEIFQFLADILLNCCIFFRSLYRLYIAQLFNLYILHTSKDYFQSNCKFIQYYIITQLLCINLCFIWKKRRWFLCVGNWIGKNYLSKAFPTIWLGHYKISSSCKVLR